MSKLIDFAKQVDIDNEPCVYAVYKGKVLSGDYIKERIVNQFYRCWDPIFHKSKTAEHTKGKRYFVVIPKSSKLTDNIVQKYADYLIKDLGFKLAYHGKKNNGDYLFEILFDKFVNEGGEQLRTRFTETRAYVFPLRDLHYNVPLVKKVISYRKKFPFIDPLYCLYLAHKKSLEKGKPYIYKKLNSGYLTKRQLFNRIKHNMTNYSVVGLYNPDNVKNSITDKITTGAKPLDMHETLVKHLKKSHYPEPYPKVGTRYEFKTYEYLPWSHSSIRMVNKRRNKRLKESDLKLSNHSIFELVSIERHKAIFKLIKDIKPYMRTYSRHAVNGDILTNWGDNVVYGKNTFTNNVYNFGSNTKFKKIKK
jgi:hypothetical protein